MDTAPEPGVVDLAAKLAAFSEHWSPKVVGELNGQQVKLVKLEGEFDWHHHEEEDELFLVLAGELRMRLRGADGGREVKIGEGQFLIVPRGVEHQPVAHGPVEMLLFEPKATRNTGNVDHAYTIEASDVDRI
jgi:mannose-6-phosphate isomerase-like protein (cupin superfamily)